LPLPRISGLEDDCLGFAGSNNQWTRGIHGWLAAVMFDAAIPLFAQIVEADGVFFQVDHLKQEGLTELRTGS